MMAEESDPVPRKRRYIAAAWSWFSEVMSVIGMISVIDNLRLWARAIGWLSARLADLLPVLQRLLLVVGQIIALVLDIFRGIFRPIVDFCLQWLPFPVPDIVKDGIVVAIFVGVGLVRTELRFFAFWSDPFDEEELVDNARKAGIRCRVANVFWLKEAIASYKLLQVTDWQVPEADLAKARRSWNEALKRFGPGIETFAPTVWQVGFWGGEEAIFYGKRRARAMIWSLAGFTIALVVIDRLFIG